MIGKRLDFDGNGRAGIPMSSPQGLGVLRFERGSLSSSATANNGTRFGGWLLNSADNVFTITGDFDGDRRTEILVASPWGLGILQHAGTGFACPMLKRNGTRFGGWLLDTTSNRFGPVGDFDGDGQDEILVSSPWGIGILEQAGDNMRCPVLLPNGTDLGGWRLNTAHDRFGPVGDYDGDGQAEFLVTSPQGIAILKFTGSGIRTVAVVNNGQRMGGWLLNTAHNHFWPSADFDGNGTAELLVTSPWGLGIIGLSGRTLASTVMAPNGTRFGGWLLNTNNNRFAPIGDLDGDGKAELLVSSPWGLGILEKSGNSLSSPWLAPNGTRFGGWLLNTNNNRFDLTADLDGDGRDEIVVTSPWGAGILKFTGGTMRCLTLKPNGARFGNWTLNTARDQMGMDNQLIRLHLKILTTPAIPLATMISEMQRIFERLGLIVQVVSTENLTSETLNDINIGNCRRGQTTTEQDQLFENRNNAGPNDIVAYFVRSTVPPSAGCAAHPAGRPACVVAHGASRWTLAHELGHILGLSHVGTPQAPDRERLMTGQGTGNITKVPPSLIATEAIAMRRSLFTHNQ